MKYYIAGKITNANRVNELVAHLSGRGWVCTYDWAAQPSLQALLADGCITKAFQVQAERTAKLELAGVRDADVVLVCGQGGRGTHVEIGAALAANKPVVLWLEESEEPYHEGSIPAYPCVFYQHPNVFTVYGPHTPRFFDYAVAQEVQSAVRLVRLANA